MSIGALNLDHVLRTMSNDGGLISPRDMHETVRWDTVREMEGRCWGEGMYLLWDEDRMRLGMYGWGMGNVTGGGGGGNGE